MARNLNLDALSTDRTVILGGKEYAVKDLLTKDAFAVKASLKAIFEREDYDEEVDKLQWKIVKVYIPDLPKNVYDEMPVMKKGTLVKYLISEEGGEEKNES